MMDHNEQLLDLMDSPFFEHKDSAIHAHSINHTTNRYDSSHTFVELSHACCAFGIIMWSSMSSLGSIDVNLSSMPSGSPLLGPSSAPFGAYTFLGANDDCLSPSSPVTDSSIHSSSSPDHDLPLSPQSEHPFAEALGGQGNLFLPLPIISSSSILSASGTADNVLSPLPAGNAIAASSWSSTASSRKRKTTTTSAVSSTKTNSRSKGRRTDAKQEAATAATKQSKSRSANKKAISSSNSRTTRSGSRAVTPIMISSGASLRDEDKTSLSPVAATMPSLPHSLNGPMIATPSSTSVDLTNQSLPLLETVAQQEQHQHQVIPTTTPGSNGMMAGMDGALVTPPHMVAAMGNLAMHGGAVTLTQPEYERMVQEEERQKEKKMRKAEQARIR
jgi:hypothetical protein